jgi:prepilin-type processing-associated H-X9-DG protein
MPGVPLSALGSDTTTVMVADSCEPFAQGPQVAFANYPARDPSDASNGDSYWPSGGGASPPISVDAHTRHQHGQNLAFFDGHVKRSSYTTFTGEIPEGETWFEYRK